VTRIDQGSTVFVRLELIAKIRHFEGQQHRPLRELAIDPTNQAARNRLTELEAAIAELRKQLT
jgi:hypothetical protein